MGQIKNDFKDYQASRIGHWDTIAHKMDKWSGCGGYYHRRLQYIYKFIIPPGQRVIEVGCAKGDLLAALGPAYGVGVDFSKEMIQRARKSHPELVFVQGDVHELKLNEKFDFIILSDLVNDLWDVQAVIEKLREIITPHTRIIINTYSRLWELPLGLSQWLRLSKRLLRQNWLKVNDIKNLLHFADFDIVRHWQEIIFPLPIPLFNHLLNKVMVKIWPFNHLGLTNFIVVKPRGREIQKERKPVVSVIVPARNEAGNISQIFDRTPEMGGGTELIFVEGHSKDNTYASIEQAIAEHPNRKCKLLRQAGTGKGDAVRCGFEHATGEILMILDADLTVPPEDLVRFYDILNQGKGEFVNGVRLVYPMEERAMRFFNLLGNHFFGMAFSWLLGQPVKDTLCGTKVLWKADYEKIKQNRSYFGDFDPFGDFDLLFGAAKLNLKIVEMPIRYRERTYGKTNIHRWRHGWLLFRMMLFAFRKIKFI